MGEGAGDQSRQAILEAIAGRGGGAHKRELCRLTGRGWGTVGHHVYVLARSGLVVTEVHGRQLWVFLPGVPRAHREWLVAMQAPQRLRLLELLRVRPKATINALSEEMDLSRKAIRTHLSHQQRVGAVRSTDDSPPAYVPAEAPAPKRPA
jgi:predicted transcriptional regulator